jgi:peptidoglycan hydrolase-like protein with peptidoglycan-binding domain
MKRTLATLAIACACIAPLTTSALTRDEILAEIARLTKVVDAIKAQLRAIGVDVDSVDPGVPNTPLPTVTSGCLNWFRTMSLGMQGSDVTQLQTFLVKQGVLDAEPTGYYGSLTRGAVYKWQLAATLDGTGNVDRNTADTMNAYCSSGRTPTTGTTGTTGTTNPRLPVAPVDRFSFTIEPKSGTAPHQVSAFFVISGTTCTAYALDWGDGTTGVSREGSTSNCDPDSINRQLTHVYQSRGTYTVTFKTIRGMLSSAPIVSQGTVVVQ